MLSVTGGKGGGGQMLVKVNFVNYFIHPTPDFHLFNLTNTGYIHIATLLIALLQLAHMASWTIKDRHQEKQGSKDGSRQGGTEEAV